jgi:hypothetical protein
VTLQTVAPLIDDAGVIIYNRNVFMIQAIEKMLMTFNPVDILSKEYQNCHFKMRRNVTFQRFQPFDKFSAVRYRLAYR